ncbi:MAG TPA: hypothetical protein VE441_09510, partial [Mycobacterium sp.]|nr:hypothetical protein [Mycobacterium sp.]
MSVRHFSVTNSRWLLVGALAASTMVVASVRTAESAPSSESPVGTWGASPVAGAASTTCPAGPGGLDNQTVRNVVFTSIAGSGARVRFTNSFGTAPLTIGAASLAVEQSGAATVAGT